jgi:AcrR family transcriptional regulator
MSTPRRRPNDPQGTDGPAKRPTKAERRRQLLAAARRVFAERGYLAATAGDVAAAAEVTLAQLARHFPDKPSLLAGLCADLAVALVPADAGGEGADAAVRLHALLEHWQGPARRDELSPLLPLLAGGPDEAGVLRGFVAGLSARLEPLVREGQQAGLFRRSVDPRRAAGELIRFLLGQCLAGPLEDLPAGDLVPPDCLLHGLLKTDI